MGNYESLSDRQKAIIKFIQRFMSDKGYPPTIREIGEAVKIDSTSVVNYNLNKLVKEGFIIRSKEVSRGIRMVSEEPEYDVVGIKMAGKIVAGLPTPHPDTEYDEEPLVIPREYIGNHDPALVYALRVSGYSMIDAMINDGDTVVLKQQEVAHNGDMVAAWLTERGETTLKYFFDEGERVRLQPANPDMKPIFVPKDKIQIQGKVLAVLRKIA
ncbi:MAG TPA: transcriptional repressor LexA [Aggregatilineales bacterium]|nr:transcriptional repressor LexA [Aggregatilineales bacterium]